MDYLSFVLNLIKDGSVSTNAGLVIMALLLVNRWMKKQEMTMKDDLEDRRDLRKKLISVSEDNKILLQEMKETQKIQDLRFTSYIEEIRLALEKSNYTINLINVIISCLLNHVFFLKFLGIP